MEIETIKHITSIAKIKLKDNEIEQLNLDLNEVLKYFESIDKINTTNIQETDITTEQISPFREDISIKPKNNVEINKNFPNKKGEYVKVIKGLKKG